MIYTGRVFRHHCCTNVGVGRPKGSEEVSARNHRCCLASISPQPPIFIRFGIRPPRRPPRNAIGVVAEFEGAAVSAGDRVLVSDFTFAQDLSLSMRLSPRKKIRFLTVAFSTHCAMPRLTGETRVFGFLAAPFQASFLMWTYRTSFSRPQSLLLGTSRIIANITHYRITYISAKQFSSHRNLNPRPSSGFLFRTTAQSPATAFRQGDRIGLVGPNGAGTLLILSSG